MYVHSLQLFALLLGMSVEEVCSTIKQLKSQFETLRDATEETLDNAGVSVKKVRRALMSIPAAKKMSHQHLKLFLRESNKEFFRSESIPELFGLVDLHWSYLEYYLLEHLIKLFSLKSLQPKMDSFKCSLLHFMEETPLTLFWEADDDKDIPFVKPEFTTMVTEHKWPPTITLMAVEMFRRAFVGKYCLHECAMMLKAAKPGSVHITWIIPQSIVHYLMKEIQSTGVEFFQQNDIVNLMLDGQFIYTTEHRKEVCIALINKTATLSIGCRSTLYICILLQ